MALAIAPALRFANLAAQAQTETLVQEPLPQEGNVEIEVVEVEGNFESLPINPVPTDTLPPPPLPTEGFPTSGFPTEPHTPTEPIPEPELPNVTPGFPTAPIVSNPVEPDPTSGFPITPVDPPPTDPFTGPGFPITPTEPTPTTEYPIEPFLTPGFPTTPSFVPEPQGLPTDGFPTTPGSELGGPAIIPVSPALDNAVSNPSRVQWGDNASFFHNPQFDLSPDEIAKFLANLTSHRRLGVGSRLQFVDSLLQYPEASYSAFGALRSNWQVLAGGYVINIGALASPAGEISIQALSEREAVRLTYPHSLLSLELDLATDAAELQAEGRSLQTLETTDLPTVLTGGDEIVQATALALDASGQVVLSNRRQPETSLETRSAEARAEFINQISLLSLQGNSTVAEALEACNLEAPERSPRPSVATEPPDPLAEITLLTALGNHCYSQAQYPLAIALYEQVLAKAVPLDARSLKATALGDLGNAYFSQGDYPRAVELFEQQLALAENESLHLEAGFAYRNLGNAHSAMKHHDQAIAFYQQAVAIAEQIDRPDLKADSLGGTGIVYFNMGRYEAAIALYEQQLQVTQERLNAYGAVRVLSNLGNVHSERGAYATAIDYYQQAADLSRSIGDHQGTALAIGNLGNTYEALGDYHQAIAAHQQQLEISRAIGDRLGEANALGNLGIAYTELERYQQSLVFHQQHLEIAQAIGDPQGEAIALNNLGETYRRLEQLQPAIEKFQQALAISQEIGNRPEEGGVLIGLGEAHYDLGQYASAMTFYQQAWLLLQSLGAPSQEAEVLSQMGRLLANDNQPELAIIFYKQAVNIHEAIRQEIQPLPSALQESFTNEIASETYRDLADILLQQDRILEAQQVLELLKVQELEEYLGPVRGFAPTVQGVDFNPSEQEIFTLYNQAIASGRELAELRAIPLSDRTPSQARRLAELAALEQQITGRFYDFIESPDVERLVSQLSRTAQRQNLNLEDLNALRDNLINLNQNAALLYPLMLEDRLELILVTPYAPPIRRTVAVGREELNQAILTFRRALGSPAISPKASAQQLYEWLVKPLEDDFAAAQIETIVYAPDAQLRYAPLAALNDGRQWLIERFQISHITAASLTDFDTPRQNRMHILAGAFSDGENRYQVEVANRQLSYVGLPYAGREVQLIAEAFPGTTKLLNDEFNQQNTVPSMNDHTIVHLATHAAFVPGHPEESFILFGDGTKATLRDVSLWNLHNVDLVVLSGCQTGVGGVFGNGEEILGFGYQMQRTGARAAIASLWVVDDVGTQILMNSLYAALKETSTAKADALRQAQIAMITGDFSTFNLEKSVVSDYRTNYSHPYYWASFILIGNGL